MHKKKRLLALTLLAAASLLSQKATLHAQIFTETLDAGRSIATASGTASTSSPVGGRLDAIVGNLSAANDADIYRLTITSTTTFSATVQNTSLDTAIFLFNSSGAAIVGNDDTNGITLASSIPAGSSFLASLSPGVYYLAISLSGNDPVNSANQLLFTTSGDPTALRGAQSGVSPATQSNFNDQYYFAETGRYQINLTGAAAIAAVPEPSTWTICIAGVALVGFMAKRRKQQAA